jgi:hypothetical protein
LAGVLERKDDLEEALRLYAIAYEGGKETLGDRHEDTKDYSQDYTKLRERLSEALLESKIEPEIPRGVVQVELNSADMKAQNSGVMTTNSMLDFDGEDVFGGTEAHIASTPCQPHTVAMGDARIVI